MTGFWWETEGPLKWPVSGGKLKAHLNGRFLMGKLKALQNRQPEAQQKSPENFPGFLFFHLSDTTKRLC